MYAIFFDKDLSLTDSDVASIEAARGHMENHWNTVSPGGDPFVLTVEDSDTWKVMASISNRRIIGRFLKQEWGGRKNDTAIEIDTVEFDATDHILLMRYEDVVEIADGDDSSDDVGLAHVAWDGPHEVTLEDSICEFFGIEKIEELTRENFEYVKERMKPQAPEYRTVEITTRVRVKVSPSAGDDAMTSFVENLDYEFTSNTPSVLVVDTEIVGSDDDLGPSRERG